MALADPIRDLKELATVERQMNELASKRIRLVAAAQAHGATWESIGAALGTTRQSAWETYSRLVRQVLDSTASGSALSEAELLDSAADSLRRYRAQRT